MPDLTTLAAALTMLAEWPGTLWPDFLPTRIPLVVWDGVQTTLFQSAAAPSGEWRRQQDRWALPYRHPALVAHTAVTLEDGTDAAALLLNDLPGSMTVPELAALIAHEAFHVYQASHCPERWQADELAVFGYPLTAPVLAARRLETLALNFALEGVGGWEGHAAEALQWRHYRFSHLNPVQQELERGLERREGLAQFVESKISGRFPGLPLPDFAPEAVRGRCYGTGAALAHLLDRSGEWQQAFMQSPLSLDELLSAWLAGWRPEAHPSELVAQAHSEAGQDADQLQAARLRMMHDALARPGQTLTLSSGKPLWPQGFDPQNVSELGGGRVMHRRYLKFGNAQVSGEALGQPVLTGAAGVHPLQHGFSSVTVPGMESARLQKEAGALYFEANGFQLRISGATEVTATPEGWEIRLP
ncbi:hypothetical protein Q0M94_15795 [Deinococcus radiomollis]|uniref:hypothetical protein n=1 Tax=Deinococcus radiomollis TaxID=468916 RepID=UPI0038913442